MTAFTITDRGWALLAFLVVVAALELWERHQTRERHPTRRSP